MTGSRFGAVALAATLFALAGSAWADPTSQEKEKARDAMADGRDKRDKSDFVGALVSFQQADAIMHVPTTGFEVAKTQQAMGQLIEAQATCVAITKLPVQPNEPPPFAEARQKADALAKDLEKQIPKLTIIVKSAGTATATVDNVAVASLVDPVRVNPGNHTIYAKAPEGDAKQDVTLAAGESKTLELQPASKVATVATAPAGNGGLMKRVPLVSWVGFGVGAAGLIVGTVGGIIAIGDKGDIQDHCLGNKCGKDQSDPLSSAKTVATISTVGFIVAGVGVAVGVVGLFVLKPKTEDAPPTATLGPIRFNPTTLSGTF